MRTIGEREGISEKPATTATFEFCWGFSKSSRYTVRYVGDDPLQRVQGSSYMRWDVLGYVFGAFFLLAIIFCAAFVEAIPPLTLTSTDDLQSASVGTAGDPLEV